MKAPLPILSLFPFLCLALAPPLTSGVAQEPRPNPFVIVGEDEKLVPGEADSAPGGESADEPEPLSAQISRHILELARAEREERLQFMEVVIDDVARLCDLDEEQREELRLAAKGAAERSMKDWHEQAERYFRTRLDGADTDAAKEMLEGMGNVNFGGNRSDQEGESLELWKDTLETVLTEKQIARYEAVLEQRQLDRIDAFARMSLTTIDEHLRLTPEQKSKMSEVVHEAATEYLEDVQRYWGDYFERGMLMSLANAAEDGRLQSILTESQFERLDEATSNFDHFWDQKRRLRRAKEKAARQRKAKAEEEEYEKREAEAPAEPEES